MKMIFWIWFLLPLFSSLHAHGFVFREQPRTKIPPWLYNPLDHIFERGPEDQQEPREGRIISIEPTPCPDKASYCEDAEDYPSFIGDLQIDANEIVKDRIFGEPVPDVTPTLRFNSQESRACAHRKEVIYPKKARNTSGIFVFIVNNPEYRQSVTIELCEGPPESQCKNQDDAPDGNTVCRQKYSTHKLYAIHSEGRQVYDTFSLPSACLCHHTQNFLLTRSNFSSDKGLSSSPGCIDWDGIHRYDGESWQCDCNICTCVDGNIISTRIGCIQEPELQCVPPAPLDVPDDKIHFPEMNQPEIPTPYCEDQTFCEEEQSYPNATILWELNQNVDLSNTLFLQLFDIVKCQRNRDSFSIGEEQLCIGSTKVVFPKVAKNLKEEWRYVVNIENYTQSVEVEECHNRTHLRDVPIQGNQDNDYGSCMYSGSDGDNPEFTSCRQLYTEHKLLSLTTEGQLEVDSFMLPSACACYVSKDIDFIEFRIGNVGNTVSNSSLEERGEDE